MAKPRRFTVERLEDRCNPATSGITWPDGQHLTLSFVPDGTRVGSYQSQLFAELNAIAPTAVWQREIVRAFQTWAVKANLNIGVVPDGGQDVGTPGAVQGDTRFGDIRIAAVPLPAGTLMTNTAFQWTGTTWSGDVLLNTSYQFSVGHGSSAYDLYTATLNEAANVFGVLDSNTDVNSGVYSSYVGPKNGLNAGDVNDIQSLYGARSPDRFETNGSNNTFSTATTLSNNSSAQNSEADITTSADVDFYKFTIPLSLPLITGFQVRATSAGLSALLPSVTIYNSWQLPIGAATGTDPLAGSAAVQVNQVGLFATYYVRVAGAVPTEFGVGSYKLNVTFQHSNGLLSNLIGGVVSLLTDNHLNDTIVSATNLTPNYLAKPDARFDATAAGVIEDANDVDYYQIRSPNMSQGSQKLNVLVWPTENSALIPKVELYNASGQLIPVQLLANENGTHSIELNNSTPGATYYVKVKALYSAGSHKVGGYRFGADFTTQRATVMTTFVQDSLTAAAPQASYPLRVFQNQLMQFILNDDAGPTGALTQVRMDILDSSGAIVFTLRSYSGQDAASGHKYLQAGQYTVRFIAAAAPNTALTSVAFRLTGQKVSDPVGPRKDSGASSNSPNNDWGSRSGGTSSAQGDWDAPAYF